MTLTYDDSSDDDEELVKWNGWLANSHEALFPVKTFAWVSHHNDPPRCSTNDLNMCSDVIEWSWQLQVWLFEVWDCMCMSWHKLNVKLAWADFMLLEAQFFIETFELVWSPVHKVQFQSIFKASRHISITSLVVFESSRFHAKKRPVNKWCQFCSGARTNSISPGPLSNFFIFIQQLLASTNMINNSNIATKTANHLQLPKTTWIHSKPSTTNQSHPSETTCNLPEPSTATQITLNQSESN